MTSYIWAGAHAYRDHANDRTVEPGEEIPEDAAERIASAHPYDVEAVDEGDAGESEDDVEAVLDDELFDPTDHTVAEIEEAVADVDSPDWLEVVRAGEEEGGNRTTALDAIDERLAELEE